MTDKPNVLFLLADDQSINTIGALGNPYIKTPNLDELVKNGTYFNYATIPGGYTGAICMPSRAMLHSGQYLTTLKNNGADISDSCKLLGSVFQENGYMTFGCGKWHNGPKAFNQSFEAGDNLFFGGMWDHWNVPVNSYDPLGNYDNVVPFIVSFNKSNKIRKMHCDRINPGIHSSDLIADTAVNFIKDYDCSRPFFCYTAFLAPHDPRTMPEEFKQLYSDIDIPLPQNYSTHYPVAYSNSDMRDEVLSPYPRTEAEIKAEIKDYYGMLSHLDSCIGRIISALKAKGIYDNTIIIFASDNGLSMGSHAFLGKQNVYEEAIRVPLLFTGPGIAKNKIINNRIYLYDIYPTLCELLSFKKPNTVESLSFAPLFKGEKYEERKEFYYIITDRARSIVKDNFKLSIYFEKNSNKFSITLYDLKNDPHELNDLSGERAKLVNELLQQLYNTRTEVNDNKEAEAICFFDGIKALENKLYH